MSNADEDFSMRHKRRMKKIRIKRIIRRTTMLIIIVISTVMICMYKLPIFNISQLNITGNSKLTIEEIAEKTGINGGENIFKTDIKKIEEDISSIPYIDSVSVKRAFLPTSVVVNVKECEMAASVKIDSIYAIIDKNAKILEIMNESPEGLVEFDGLKITDYAVGRQIAVDEDNVIKDITIVLNVMNGFEYKDKIGPISFEDLSDISFSYDNRLDVMCGSIIDFERKINMLEEIIRSDNIKDNSRGTLNLRTPGKIIHRP